MLRESTTFCWEALTTSRPIDEAAKYMMSLLPFDRQMGAQAARLHARGCARASERGFSTNSSIWLLDFRRVNIYTPRFLTLESYTWTMIPSLQSMEPRSWATIRMRATFAQTFAISRPFSNHLPSENCSTARVR
jgi:hypothetical protein